MHSHIHYTFYTCIVCLFGRLYYVHCKCSRRQKPKTLSLRIFFCDPSKNTCSFFFYFLSWITGRAVAAGRETWRGLGLAYNENNEKLLRYIRILVYLSCFSMRYNHYYLPRVVLVQVTFLYLS